MGDGCRRLVDGPQVNRPATDIDVNRDSHVVFREHSIHLIQQHGRRLLGRDVGIVQKIVPAGLSIRGMGGVRAHRYGRKEHNHCEQHTDNPF
ncbi:hypothetical protein SDC9_197111 [bioreactor metagenome]|uniref:Uncharacterized protein n=1 Tax=bioreactor metagenome TaxID=1076179 RepID=A0A645IEE0_9ZZZZ